MRAPVAIVPAAGRGRRLGQDKALVDLRGRPAVCRLVGTLQAGGVQDVVLVRRRGADPLPEHLPVSRRDAGCRDVRGLTAVEVDETADMIATVAAGLGAVPDDRAFLVHPVDLALVAPETVEAVVRRLGARDEGQGAAVVLPRAFDRVGHPAGFAPGMRSAVLEAARRPGATLRDVIRAAEPVVVVDADDPWIRADLDDAEDLRVARACLDEASGSVLGAMRRHRSCRAFTGDRVDPALVDRILDAARHCSTSSFAQLVSLVVVEDPAQRARVAELCAGQEHVRDAPVFVAVCADLERVGHCCASSGRAPVTGSLEAFVQAAVDAALVGQNAQLAAESLGLGGCMIGAARNHPVELAEMLGLPPGVFVVYGLVLGWPAGPRVPHGRMPLDLVRHRGRWSDTDRDRLLAAADEGMRAWAHEINRHGGYGGRPVDEGKGWSDRMAGMWGSERGVKGRLGLAGALRRLGFLGDEHAGGVGT